MRGSVYKRAEAVARLILGDAEPTAELSANKPLTNAPLAD